jgi:mono/diheme cytochrome c family protein
MTEAPKARQSMLVHNRSVLATVMHSIKLLFVVAAAILAAQFPALSEPITGDPVSGREIASKQCSSCHHVLPRLFSDRKDPPSADTDGAPSFQSIADLPSTTGLSLNVFLHSNHKNMPNLVLSHADSDDLIAYILSLKKP